MRWGSGERFGGEGAHARARQSVSGETGAVRIGFSGVAVLAGVLTADLHRFHQAHPGVALSLTELPPAAQVQALRDGTIDVAYCPELGLGDVENLVLTRRARIPLAIAVRHDHELATADSVSMADLTGEDLIVFAADETDEPLLATAPAGHRARVHHVTGMLGSLALAAAGAGVAILPAAAEHLTLPEIVYRPLRGKEPEPALMTISRSEDLSGPVRAFVDHSGGLVQGLSGGSGRPGRRGALRRRATAAPPVESTTAAAIAVQWRGLPSCSCRGAGEVTRP